MRNYFHSKELCLHQTPLIKQQNCEENFTNFRKLRKIRKKALCKYFRHAHLPKLPFFVPVFQETIKHDTPTFSQFYNFHIRHKTFSSQPFAWLTNKLKFDILIYANIFFPTWNYSLLGLTNFHRFLQVSFKCRLTI